MLRNRYKFSRPLTEGEAVLLTTLITWRRGSSVVTDESGSVIACECHPDDVAEFRKRLRELGAPKLAIAEARAESGETSATPQGSSS